MWRIGFGFERLGLVAVRFPAVFSVLLIALVAIAGYSVQGVSFNGSVLSVLPDKSQAYLDYYAMNGAYRNFSRDVTVLVESDRLLTANGLEDLRNLQLDVSLADGVSKAVSIFSTPDFDPDTGESRDWFPNTFENDQQARDLVTSLISKYPRAASLFSVEDKVAVMVVSLDVSVQEDDGKSFVIYERLRSAAQEFAPEDFKLSFTGLTPVGASIMTALINDQMTLTVFGLLLGTGIAFAIFRSFMAAFLCAIPPALTALWSFGLFAISDIAINYLTTVLPTLALILAFADGIFLYFRWQTLTAENPEPEANLKEAIVKVGPASSLTSITTALAFLSFAYAESEALNQFAWLGAGVVSLAFVAVIVGLPLAIYWSIRLGLIRPKSSSVPMFQGIGRLARKLPIRHPVSIALTGIALVILFGGIQTLVKAEYRLTDYLPRDSDVRYGEELANHVTGGRALMLVSVPFANPGAFADRENRERLKTVEDALATQFDRNLIFSANQVLERLDTKQAIDEVNQLTMDAPANARTDFVSKDNSAALFSVRLSSNMPVTEVRVEVAKVREALADTDLSNEILITGFPILMSIEFTNLIDQLRTSLLIAILLGVMIVGLATRSPFITLAAITPNLLPIFFVLVFLYLLGGTINLSQVVALTVAFGIAIDNAVHLINVYDAQLREGKDKLHSLSAAIEEVGPALTAGTLIICFSTLVTQLSSLPVVPTLGQLMISTLIVALVSNLIVLPANILTLEQIKGRFRSDQNPENDG